MTLDVEPIDARAGVSETQLRRCLVALTDNAIGHTPQGGHVRSPRRPPRPGDDPRCGRRSRCCRHRTNSSLRPLRPRRTRRRDSNEHPHRVRHRPGSGPRHRRPSWRRRSHRTHGQQRNDLRALPTDRSGQRLGHDRRTAHDAPTPPRRGRPQLGPLVSDELGEQWTVTLCVDGESALETAAKEYFDVMVIDRRLPGSMAPRWSRPFGSGASAPLCSCSPRSVKSTTASPLDAGANDYLVKPFDFDELTARLRALTRDYTGTGATIEIAVGHSTPRPQHHLPYTGRVMLTEKETALLRLLAGEPSRAFTRQHLLSAVFDNGEQPRHRRHLRPLHPPENRPRPHQHHPRHRLPPRHTRVKRGSRTLKQGRRT